MSNGKKNPGGGRFKFAPTDAPVIDLPHHPDEPKPLGDVVGGCVWIHPAPPKRAFCGHKTVDGNWCRHHRDRVYARVTPAEAQRRLAQAHVAEVAAE